MSHVIYRDTAERIATSVRQPNPHTQLYVLDDNLRPVPAGASGELNAAGFLLGRGYVNAACLTASRFVANPFDTNGSRMHRTGDLARWTAEDRWNYSAVPTTRSKSAAGASSSRRSSPRSPPVPRCAGSSLALSPHPSALTTSSAISSPAATLTPAALPARRHNRFVVVGAGQSAAEVLGYLHGMSQSVEVYGVFAKYGYSPDDDSQLANRVFDPNAVDDFYTADPGVRRQLLNYHRSTNYSAVDLPPIEELYAREYAERVAGNRRLFPRGASSVHKTEEDAGSRQ